MNCLPIFSRGLAAAALALSLAACAGTGPGAPAPAANKDALVSLNDTFRATYRETRAWRLSRGKTSGNSRRTSSTSRASSGDVTPSSDGSWPTCSVPTIT